MTVPIEILNMIECCLSNDGHYVKEAILLKCSGNACKDCVSQLKSNYNGQLCYNCNKIHTYNDCNSSYLNKTIDILIDKVYLNDLISIIKNGFNETLKSIEDLDFEESINSNIDFIEYEIDIKIESLKEQLDKISETYRERLKEIRDKLCLDSRNKIESIKNYIKYLEKNFVVNADNLREYQQKLNDCKNEIEKITEHIPQITFEPSESLIDDILIGKFIENYECKYERIKSTKSFKMPTSKYLFSMAHMNRTNKNNEKCILITDNEDNSIKKCDLNGKYMNTYAPIKLCNGKPSALCVNNNDEIFVADWKNKKIIVFNSKFEYLREFGDSNIVKPDSMIIDNDTSYLYITDFDNDKLTVWNSVNGKFIKQIKIDSAGQIQMNKDNLYILSENDYEQVKSTGRIRVTKGSNSIFIINKLNLEIINKIKIDSWFDPCGLYVDKNNNILTTAFELDNDKYISSYRYLYMFNSNGSFINKLKLDVEYFTDMLFIDHKIYFCQYDNLKVIEFD